MFKLNQLIPAEFLRDYWQKKPVVVRGAFANFVDPVDENELAGLAQEEGIDSRIVSVKDDKWTLAHGPFEDFTEHCQNNWSLLVQNVNAYSEEADELIRAFDFIPVWRTDDLMVSYSVPGAGVGPHLDQYDVFIIQGKGTRRWKVGNIDNFTELKPHPQLRQIEQFTPIIDEILHAGDMIYIPPGFPHEGVALEECLNYSVGFRAPEQSELISSFADYVIDTQLFNQRYTDPELTPRDDSSEIKQYEVEKFRDLVAKMVNSTHFDTWLYGFLSRSASVSEPIPEAEKYLATKDVERMVKEETAFIRGLGLKFVIPEINSNNQNEVTVFINEIPLNVPLNQLQLVKNLLNQSVWQNYSEINNENSIFFIHFMTTLLNAGLWYPE